MNISTDLRKQMLMRLFDAAVQAAAGDHAVETALSNHVAEQVFLVAVGKAAAAMTHGALRTLGDRVIDGLVISKYHHIDDELRSRRRLRCLESAHPVPDHNSLIAGQALQDYLRKLPASAELVFLVSGGTSSLVESLPASMSLQDLMRVNQYLLASGLDIRQMNHIRKSLSEIKGGRLAHSLRNRKTLQLLISDVPGDVPNAIGSGLLIPPETGDVSGVHQVPDWLEALQQMNCDALPAHNPVWSRIESRIVASNKIARRRLLAEANKLDLHVCLEDGELSGDVTRMAAKITQLIVHPDAAPGLYIWGGETTVHLPDSPGRGGRNQQMALQIAENLTRSKGGPAQWQVLSCGTDGSDGPTGDAGGYFDQESFAAALAMGLDPQAHLLAADAGTFLQRSNALVTTGPTGTNVMDLVLVFKGQ